MDFETALKHRLGFMPSFAEEIGEVPFRDTGLFYAILFGGAQATIEYMIAEVDP